MPDGSVSTPTQATDAARHCILAPAAGKASDGLSRKCVVDGATVLTGGDTVVLRYLSPKPYAVCSDLPAFDARFFRLRTEKRWRNPEPLIGPKRATRALEEEWLDQTDCEIEPALRMQNGRVIDPDGHNPATYNHTAPHAPDETNPDDDAEDPIDLPDSDCIWAETFSDTDPRTKREPNPLPDLPPWATARFRDFLEAARLTPNQIRKMLRSPALAARRLAEHAEALASGFGERNQKKREPTEERASAVLQHFLQLADEIQNITRRDSDRYRARRETVRQLPASKRRTEMLDMYRELLRPTRERGDERRRDIVAIYAEECRGRTQHHTRNGTRHGWYLLDFEHAAALKSKATSNGCSETPVSACALMSKRARELSEV
jgi:hypothetical protein